MQWGKKKEGIQIKKEEIKLYLFADDMIFYVENFKESMKKYLLELISEFILVVGTRSTYKNKFLVYTLAMNYTKLKFLQILGKS